LELTGKERSLSLKQLTFKFSMITIIKLLTTLMFVQ